MKLHHPSSLAATFSVVLSSSFVSAAYANESFWLMRVPSGDPSALTAARPFPDADVAVLADIFSRLPEGDGGAAQCVGLAAGATERAELSPPTAVLAGLKTVGFAFNAPKPPPGFDSTFAETVFARLVEEFTKGGLQVASSDAASQLSGQPKLTMALTFADPNGACGYSYSVSASLTQTAVLTRDLAAKFNATTWSTFMKSNADFGPGQEADLPIHVAGKFLEAWIQANAAATGQAAP